MKILFTATIATLLTGCTVTPRYYTKEVSKQKSTVSDRVSDCVFRMIEQSGIDANKAEEACNKIYRRQ